MVAVIQVIGLVFTLCCRGLLCVAYEGQVARDFCVPRCPRREPMMKRRVDAGAGAKPQTLRI